MELSIEQQILEYWNKAKKVLVVLPENPGIDRTCSAVALQLMFQKMQKQADIVCPTGLETANLDFIPTTPVVLDKPADQNILTINLDTSRSKLDELSYQAEETAVKIFLKPKNGQFSPNDIGVSVGGSAYDLIICIGAQNLEAFGKAYQESPQLFFNTPKINVDTNPANEYYGTINLIDVTASSLSEVVTRLIDANELGVIDENIATVLMGGIIAHTHSFQEGSTTPQTLSIASKLITQGARQQDIIKTLYKTKDFALLKLWGRALARIKTAKEGSFLYSFLLESDFAKTGLAIDSLPQVMSELIDNVAGFQAVALMGEHQGKVDIIVAGLPHAGVDKIARALDPRATSVSLPAGSHLYKSMKAEVPGVLEEAENKLLSAVL